jgi:hypothetical protein
MALTRTLEMLKAGERINDLLYRSTVNGSRQLLARRLAYGRATAGRGAGSRQERIGVPAASTMQMPGVRHA